MNGEKIRILQTIRQGKVGGGESHLLALVDNLDKDKFESIVLSFTDGPMVDQLKQKGINTHVIHTETPFDIFKWKKVRSLLHRENISIVHAHGTRAMSNILWASKNLKIPVVYTIHGWSFHSDQTPVIKNLRIRAEKYLTGKSNVNITVSSSNVATALKHFDLKSTTIPYGIDINKFDPRAGHKEIRRELNIDREAILVLFVARFTLQKQPLTVIKSFAKALQKNHSLRLLMVGNGELKEECLQLINKLTIRNFVYNEPFREDVADLLANSDIYVLPSLWEGLPIGLLEAMAMEKAVIATNIDGTTDVIVSNENGILIDVDHAEEELSTSMVLLSHDEALRKRLGENAGKLVRNEFSISSMIQKIEQAYLGCIK